MKRMYNETFLWLFNDNNNFEYTAGYKVKHNNFVSCEHLSTHNSKAEKIYSSSRYCTRNSSSDTKGNKTWQHNPEKWNRNDDHHHNNVVCALTKNMKGKEESDLVYTPWIEKTWCPQSYSKWRGNQGWNFSTFNIYRIDCVRSTTVIFQQTTKGGKKRRQSHSYRHPFRTKERVLFFRLHLKHLNQLSVYAYL